MKQVVIARGIIAILACAGVWSYGYFTSTAGYTAQPKCDARIIGEQAHGGSCDGTVVVADGKVDLFN